MTTTDLPPNPGSINAEPPVDGPDGVGPDGVGPDGVGPDGVGPDGVGLDGVGPDGVGLDGSGVSGVDPRMRERWIEVRRAEGRRRLWILSCVMAVAALLGIGFVVARSPLFGADTVTIRGTSSISAAVVRSAAGVEDGEPLLFLDTVAVARRVEALPAVEHATVTTELPNTVIIRVRERHPIGVVRGTGAEPIAVVDHDGRVISREAVAPPGLPVIVGAGSAPGLGQRLALVAAPRGLAMMSPQLRVAVTRFTITEGVATARLATGSLPVTVIRFGRAGNMEAKSKVALAVMEDMARRAQRVRLLDVSVPSAPATR